MKSTARIHALSLAGLDALPIEIEVDIAPGLPNFIIVGLPDTAVSESKDRVRSAIRNSGFEFPKTRVTVNLAPAHTRKVGPLFDLPIALGVLLANTAVAPALHTRLQQSIIVGELALDGRIRPIIGALTLFVAAQKRKKDVIAPSDNMADAELVASSKVFLASTLSDVVNYVLNGVPLAHAQPKISRSRPHKTPCEYDFQYILGHAAAKRALEIAAAGGHNILLIGPPGSGKSLLAKALGTILPPLTDAELIETRMIHSYVPTIPPPTFDERPFRAPHHGASAVAIIGGGTHPMPGEISLAHHGVLFLDEFPEFRRDVIEGLRQPMEDGVIHIARAQQSVRFPARFLLCAAMNPCPCGFANDPEKECTCLPGHRAQYERKLSGPLRDRIDLVTYVPRIPYATLRQDTCSESSTEVRQRVCAARTRQYERCGEARTNATMTKKEINKWCQLPPSAHTLLEQATQTLQLSPRSILRVMKVARTIADLEGISNITDAHVQEALQYRLRE